MRALYESLIGDPSSLSASSTNPYRDFLTVQPFNHPCEVIVAAGRLLTSDSTTYGIANEKDPQFYILLPAEGQGQPYAVVRAFTAVGRIVED